MSEEEKLYYFVWIDPDDDKLWICPYKLTATSAKGLSLTFTADPIHADSVIKRRKSDMLPTSKIAALREFQVNQIVRSQVFPMNKAMKFVQRIVAAEEIIKQMAFCPAI